MKKRTFIAVLVGIFVLTGMVVCGIRIARDRQPRTWENRIEEMKREEQAQLKKLRRSLADLESRHRNDPRWTPEQRRQFEEIKRRTDELEKKSASR